MNSKHIRWMNYKGVLLPDGLAPHAVFVLDKKEQKQLLKTHRAHLARWVSEWDTLKPKNYWYVIKDSFFGLEELKRNMRTQVRKGLKNCSVSIVESDFIIMNGYDIFKKAFEHYQKKDPSIKQIPSENYFIESYEKVADTSEFWGVFEKKTNKLIGFAENVIRDGAVIYGSIKFDPNYNKLYGSYALIHMMNKHYLQDQTMKYVCDGPRSLYHQSNIQEMLISKFNFRKAYCKMSLAISFPAKGAVILLYPFRRIFYKINMKIFKDVSVVLKMYEISKAGKDR